MKKLGVIIMSFTVFVFFVACSSTSATHTADDDSSSSDTDSVIDDSVDETHDEQVDETVDETVDEDVETQDLASNDSDEIVDEDTSLCSVTQCEIGGACYDDGEIDPLHLCFVCDISRATDGWSPQTSGDICRVSSGECDLAEKCDGINSDCPLDTFKPLDAPCGDGTVTDCNNADSCDGFGACRDNFVANLTACTDDGDACNGSESCDGAGACITVGPPVSCGDREICLPLTGVCECDASRSYFDSPAGDFCSFAGINVPPTSALKCYSASADIGCPTQVSGLPFFGQDAQYIDNERVFTKSGTAPEEVVVDSMTGLKWQFVSASGNFTYAEAVAHCSGLTYNGETGWRLPNYKELASTLDFRYSVPVCDTAFCPGHSSFFWVAESVPGDDTRAFLLYFYNADTRQFAKTSDGSAICVKGTPFDPSGVLTSDGDATDPVVTDSLTKLSWSKVFPSTQKNFEEGLAYCEALDYASHTDWRVPNVNELMTLFSYSVTPQPAAAQFDYFPAMWLLTSTTYDFQKNMSYAIYAGSGSVARRDKTSTTGIICVR